MARKKTNKKAESRKTAKTMAKKNVLSEKANVLADRISGLKNKRYFPWLFAVLILALLLYAGKGMIFAATVGGRPITRLALIKDLEKRGGSDALEGLITKELIAQEARKNGVSVAEAEVGAELDRIRGIVEGQGTTLDAALEMQGQTMSDLEENIRVQKLIEKLLADKIQVTDEEISKYYEENKEIYGADAKYEDIREGIKAQLIQEKLSTEFEAYLAKLRSEKKIIYLVDFD